MLGRIKRVFINVKQRICSIREYKLPITYLFCILNQSSKMQDYLMQYTMELLLKYENQIVKPEDSKKVKEYRIWTMWWQGEDKMPPIIKKCYQSLVRNARDEVILITKDNIKEYLEIPQCIEEGLKEKHISFTHFSDYVRMALLNKYGGLWVDASIYVTKPIENYYNYSLYSRRAKNSANSIVWGRWGIYLLGTNQINHPLFHYMENYWLEHWKQHTVVLDYFQTDYMIAGFVKLHSEVAVELAQIPYNNEGIFRMLKLLNSQFNKSLWDEIIEENEFQKLSQKKMYVCKNNKKITFAGYILQEKE